MDRLEEHEIGYLEGIVARYEWAYHDYYSNADVSVDVDDVKTLEKAIELIKAIPSAEQKTGRYEKHIDHTDCIWYGSDSGCPVTCSQYRDGWNDAMDYIFKNGKGYQPYRHDG